MIARKKATLILVMVLLTLTLLFGANSISKSSDQTAVSNGIDQPNQLYVGASYMTFWGTGMPWHDWNSGAPVDFPNATLGNYSSADPTTARQQIEIASDHNITFFFLDYGWGDSDQNSSMVNASINGIIDASESPSEAAKNFSFCVMYFTDWRVLNPLTSAATIDEVGLNEDFSFLHETYFIHKNYLKLGGNYTVILEDFQKYLNASYILNSTGEYQNSPEQVNDEFYKLKTDYNLSLIPAFWPNYNVDSQVLNDSRRVYDALTLLGDNTILNINGPILNYSEYAHRSEENFLNWNQTAANSNVSFVPLICPGYSREINSVYYNNSNPKWWAITTRDPTYPNVTLWKEVWQAALNYSESSSNEYHMVLLFTWNDYNEGTYIEPSMEYNSTYLDAIPEFPSTILLFIVPLIATLIAVVVQHEKSQSK